MEKILVLAGGRGSERAVSASSGKRVAEAFCSLGIKTALIDPISQIDPSAEHFFNDFDALKKKSTLFEEKGSIVGKSSVSGCDGVVENSACERNVSKENTERRCDVGEENTAFENNKNGKAVEYGCDGGVENSAHGCEGITENTVRGGIEGREAVRCGSDGKEKPVYITDSVLCLCKKADAVFIMLHGGIGENGSLQALFDCIGVKYFGSSHLGSAAAMDKLHAKRIFESVGILTPVYTVWRGNGAKKAGNGRTAAPCPPRYPCVVKPVSEGSSIGVTLVKTPAELERAVEAALAASDTVLMEAEIKGREITVGVLEDKALAVTEILPLGGFYDYESKYIKGKTKEKTPAEISEELTARALRLAERAHRALGLSGFSRVDMIIEGGTELIYVLEVNTIPGMTETSLLPEAAKSRGISFSELCRRMAK